MKQAYLSRLAGRPLTEFLYKQGYKVNYVTEIGLFSEDTTHPDRLMAIEKDVDYKVDPRIATHADIYMCQLGLWDEAGIFMGDKDKLGPVYPADIIYNAVCTRDYFIHYIQHTDEELVDAVMTWRRDLALHDIIRATSDKDSGHRLPDEEEMKIVGVSQGYSRCTCLPVDNNSFITSDKGLAGILENQGAAVLLIETGHILLPGYSYGFIGGCAGNIYLEDGTRAIVFNGNLGEHPDCERIDEFIKCRNIIPVWFDDYPLEDIGSIFATE